MLNLQEWLDMHESPKEIGGIVCYVRSHDVAVLVDQIRREKAEPVSVQDVEEFIRDNEFFTSVANPEDKDGTYSVSVYDLRAWMAGHARVPVEPLAMNETKSIREILFRGWPGCSNHGCIVRGEQQGMATNGQCKCLVDASRTQLHMLQGRLSAVIRAQEPHNE